LERTNLVSDFVRAGVFIISGVAVCGSTAHAQTVCTTAAEAKSGRVFLQEGRCDERVTPASTFKIALSLMGFDSGFLVDERHPELPYHETDPSWRPSWAQATDPTSWIKYSVVWYSWRITEALGKERFKRYVSTFHYGNEDVSGHPNKNDGLTQAWLSSSLKISPLEQLEFLERLVRRQLPVTEHAYEMTDRVTFISTLANGWAVHGKTGTGFVSKNDGSVDKARQIGWFVGWATKDDRTIVFAHCIQDEKPEPTPAGMRARETLMERLPTLLGSP